MGLSKNFYYTGHWGTMIIIGILIIVLSCSAKNIPGKKWLVASSVLWLTLDISFFVIPLLVFIIPSMKYNEWYQLSYILEDFRNACFCVFLFSL